MTIKQVSCFVMVCDGGCDDPWEGEGTPHFDTEAEAVEIVRSYGWVVVGDRALCRSCAVEEGCRLTGHAWPEAWIESTRRSVTFRYRFCENCSGSEFDPPYEQLAVLAQAADILDGTDG